MRIGKWCVVALLVASTGCAGQGWLGQGTNVDDEQPSAIREAVSQKGMNAPNGMARAGSAKRPEPADINRGKIAQASHTEPVESKPAPKSDIRTDKGSFSKQFAQARGLESSGKLDEARAIYQDLISNNPQRWEPYHRLGLVADRQRRFSEAESLLSEALRRKPMDAEIFGDLGYCYYLQGKLEKAESAFSKAISIRPSDARNRNNLGLVYGAKGQNDKALECFRHAGSEADAQYNMAFVLAMRNDMDGAKKRFQAALAVDPNHEASRKALRSFEQADREGDDNYNADFVADGRPWVPYQEGATQQQGRAAGNSTATRVLQSKARDMLQNRMADKPGR